MSENARTVSVLTNFNFLISDSRVCYLVGFCVSAAVLVSLCPGTTLYIYPVTVMRLFVNMFTTCVVTRKWQGMKSQSPG